MLISLIILAIVGIGAFFVFQYLEREVQKSPSIISNPQPLKSGPKVVPLEMLHADAFRGILESVDLGETRAVNRMSIVVSAKEMRKEIRIQNDRVEVGAPMGKFIGVANIEELKAHIGKPIEIYAQKVDETHYTWYGSNDYYVRVLQ